MEIYTCIVLLFTLSEVALVISKRSKSSAVKSQADKSSMLLLWITISVCLTAAGFISGYKIWVVNNVSIAEKAGITLAVAGFIIRWTAIVQLGKMFTVDVAISNTHILKTSGLYKFVRHPSYLGLI
jgi:protein-S-isoprenylcysteine O-methyltransferase Ste14